MTQKEIQYTIRARGKAGGPIEDVEEYLRNTLDRTAGITWEISNVTETED